MDVVSRHVVSIPMWLQNRCHNRLRHASAGMIAGAGFRPRAKRVRVNGCRATLLVIVMERPPTPLGTHGAAPLERLPEEWAEVLGSWGEPKYRGAQVFEWIHKRGVSDPEQMTNLSKELRQRLALDGVRPAIVSHEVQESADTTRKFLLHLRDRQAIESVLIPGKLKDNPHPSPPVNKLTQCVSSQVGCAMGCVFCASGVAGLKRNLTAAEIVSQVLFGRSQVRENERLQNLVFMGMGEPLHNYQTLRRALTLIAHPKGINLSLRRITVSTSGLVREINQLREDFGGHVLLAVSLHATSDEKRSRIMPINRKYPIAELMGALRAYACVPRNRITIEYTLIRGVNDSVAEADELARMLRGIPVKINLIPMNPIAHSELGPPEEAQVAAFQERLRTQHYTVFVRRRKGDDIDAACGQLALRGAVPKIRSHGRVHLDLAG
jgi:23S rRNA (adenine2503-C2)-methyltransferase